MKNQRLQQRKLYLQVFQLSYHINSLSNLTIDDRISFIRGESKTTQDKTVENPEEIDIDNVENGQEDDNQGNDTEIRQQNGQARQGEDEMMVS